MIQTFKGCASRATQERRLSKMEGGDETMSNLIGLLVFGLGCFLWGRYRRNRMMKDLLIKAKLDGFTKGIKRAQEAISLGRSSGIKELDEVWLTRPID